MLPRQGIRPLLTLILIAAVATPPQVFAGKTRLKNSTTIDGDFVPIKGLTPALIKQTQGNTESFPIIMIHAGYKRYFVPRTKVAGTDGGPNLGGADVFDFKRRFGRREPGFRVLGGARELRPWSVFGRRTVVVPFARGGRIVEEKHVQAVTKITPKYVEVESLMRKWQYGIATTSIRPDLLRAWIYKTIDEKKLIDRKAVVEFFLKAGMDRQAGEELNRIVKDFPGIKKWAQEMRFELRQLTAKRIITELRHRKAAGQHQLVYRSCLMFPKVDVTGSVLREVGLIKKEYDEAAEKAGRALMKLAELESKLKDPKHRKAVQPMRSEVSAYLSSGPHCVEVLPRLDAFLKLSADSAEKNLARAYSGWVAGSAYANEDLDLTIRLWETRFLVMEYLRTENPLTRKRLLEKIRKQEGVKPELIAHMIPYLPPILESPDVKPGVASVVQVAGRAGIQPVKYAVMLPPEYNPARSYPAIVALRPGSMKIESEIEWWAGSPKKPGQAQRHGYIVIAPEYADGKAADYDYSTQAHAAVIHSLRDARKRFNIDSDRVFLSGHGTGGDAAFDIGMSHPDLFAGVMPITGISDKFCKWYYLNAKDLPWYIVSGELARDSLTRNARELTKMMTKHPVFDVIYAEYIGRGYESFYEEIHNLFDWMTLHKRRKHPKKIEAKTMRVADDRFWWIKGAGFPPNVVAPGVLVAGAKKRPPMIFEAWVNAANNVMIKSGADQHTLWLSPEFIDFSKRVEIRMLGVSRKLYSDYIARDIGVLLEDLRIRGDRQKLYWAKLEVSRTGR